MGRCVLAGKKMLGKVPTTLKSATSWLPAAAWDGAGLSGEVHRPCSSLGTMVPCRGRADDGAACCCLAAQQKIWMCI